MLQWLPRPVRHAVLRRKATLAREALQDVEVEIAHTREGYLDAFRLVHDAYAWRGWITPQANGVYLTQHHALPQTTVFVLRQAGRCVATVSLVLDSGLGLPFERTFPEMAALRGPNRVVAEIGSLAVVPELRGTGVTICLFAALWRYARHLAGVTDLVIAVDAHVVDHYEGLFGFKAMGKPRSYQGFGEGVQALEEDPVAGLHQDLSTVDDWSAVYDFQPRREALHVWELASAPFPSAWEKYPPHEGGSDLARFKLPRHLFQEFFVGPDAMAPLEPATQDYVLHFRTPQTVTVPPQQRLAWLGLEPSAA